MRNILLMAAFGLAVSLTVFSQQAQQALHDPEGNKVEPPEARCSSLAVLVLDGAKVSSAQLVPPAAVIAGVKLNPRQAHDLPAFCRVMVTDRPSSDSAILTEVWLPAAGWNGKYRGQGNGGFAGEIGYSLMAAAVAEGYATAGTDTGHAGGAATFALGHPEKVKDFGWRAVHDMTVQAKALAAAFYGRAPEHSYFASCSDGGREALMEAQRFPADYDGILAGAPAYNWTDLVASGTVDTQALLASPASYIPASKVPAIAAAVLARCDALDGVTDGVLNDPRACRFDPATLACKDGDASTCLMPEQVATLKTIYAPKVDGEAAKVDGAGRQDYPGYLPGGEDGRGGWVPWIVGEAPGKSLQAFFGQGYFANFVHEQPGWDFKSFDFDKDLKLAREKTAQSLNATDTNLKPFVDRGGRLILYHGWDDPAIPALGTIDYYNGVVSVLGQSAANAAVRLYMIPGMQHCGGGPGATVFGQSGEDARGDAQHDVFTALEQWVETGKAPGRLVARGEAMSRPLCVYPAVAKYTGGDAKDAKDFTCEAPSQ